MYTKRLADFWNKVLHFNRPIKVFFLIYIVFDYSWSCSVKLSNRKANKVVCVHGKINNILLSIRIIIIIL